MKKLIAIVFLFAGLAGYSQSTQKVAVTKIINDSIKSNGNRAITAGTLNAVINAVNNLAQDSTAVVNIVAASALNNYTSSVSFATGSGLLTLQRAGLSALNASLDGRYLRYTDTTAMLAAYLGAINTMQAKLATIATGATANSTDAQLRDRTTHTGVQPATSITEDATHRFATDAEKTTWNAKEPAITGGTTSQYLRGDKSLATFPTITGTNTGDETATTIRSKLGVTTLSGSNTGDQDLSGYSTTATINTALALKQDASTAATLTGSQTLTNKTLTSPVISSIVNVGTLALPTTNGTLALTSQITGTNSGTNTGDETTSRINALYGYTPANPSTVTAKKDNSDSVGITAYVTGGKHRTDSLVTKNLIDVNTTALAGKQATISVTNTGTSGAATLVAGTLNIPLYSAGGGGDASTNTSTSVDGEVTLFSGTAGKTVKRATISGIPKLTSGVLGTATSGTDYGPATSALATGILKSTTTTGAHTIAIAADFPTLNQSTTGSAATLTTPRAIYGNNFDGSAAITAIIGSAFGGTGNGFTAFTGPTTSAKTFTLPNASATVLTDNAAVTGAQGGTGVNNSGKTVTLGGNLTTSGAFATTFTTTATTNVTLPTTGTLATQAGTETLSGKTLTSPTINALTATGTVVLPSTTSIGSVTSTELGYVSGVTSAIQTQLAAKQPNITLTTTGTSGAATLISNTLNIPQYTGGGGVTDSSVTLIKLASSVSVNLVPAYIDASKPPYNFVADGTTDNANAWTKLQIALSGNSKPEYYVVFPEGTILTSNNHGIVNIRRLHVIGSGKGTVFRSIYSGATEGLQRPFYVGDPFITNSLTWNGGATTTNVYRFKTDTAGSTTINLLNIADATNFAVGQRLLLFGFDQIGNGYPPGTRFNEWHEVRAVDNTTGIITLKKSLKNNWKDTWHDVPNIVDAGKNSGKPRIVILDRADYIYPEILEFNNCTFGIPSGAVSGASGSLQLCANYVLLNNVVAEGHFWPSMTEKMVCNNLRCVGDPSVGIVAEIDKMGGSLILNDCYFGIDVSNGTGWDRIESYNTQFDEAVTLCARHEIFRGGSMRGNRYPSTFNSPLGSAPTASPVLDMEIENIKFFKTPANQSNEAIEAVAHGSYTITNVSGNNIVIPFSTETDNTSLVSFYFQMHENSTRLHKNDGTKSGIVNSLTYDETYNPTTQTGTITTTTSSKTVTGSGTNFTGQFATGANVLSGGVFIGIVYLVNSNTSITLYEPAATAVTGAAVQKAQGAFIVGGSWNVAPVAGEVWQWVNVQNLIDKGGHENIGNYTPLATQRTLLRLSQSKNQIRTVVLNFDHTAKNGSVEQPYLRGKILSIEVVVSKPYNGTGTGANLYITDASFNNILTINTKTAGRRYITKQALVGNVTGDAGDITKLETYFDQIDYTWRESGGAAVSDISKNSWPIYEVIIRMID